MSGSTAKRGRPAGGSGAETRAAILQHGAALMQRHGYGAMSLRELAEAAGITVGAVYNHIDSKQALLVALLDRHMRDALDGLDRALAASTPAPADRLRAFVRFHITFHTGRPVAAAICLSELRSLEEPHRAAIIGLRDAYEARLGGVLADGIASGAFAVPDPRLAVLFVLGTLTGVLTWFDPKGPLSAEAIADGYTVLLMRALQAR